MRSYVAFFFTLFPFNLGVSEIAELKQLDNGCQKSKEAKTGCMRRISFSGFLVVPCWYPFQAWAPECIQSGHQCCHLSRPVSALQSRKRICKVINVYYDCQIEYTNPQDYYKHRKIHLLTGVMERVYKQCKSFVTCVSLIPSPSVFDKRGMTSIVPFTLMINDVFSPILAKAIFSIPVSMANKAYSWYWSEGVE
ncbi:uncharacterized protein G2W53_013447 [Senna tora]|uniref:Uncharacterized protein n=1 Tax=Senna tora TaxID=362788 RepID=A0A834TZR8_9FABA|nr:uncharacterized protein G2W53_013447 [Senna tora]